MPSTATLTALYSFTAGTRIKSAEVNNNFSAFRGHMIAIDPTATALVHNTYDLGSSNYRWRDGYVRSIDFLSNTTSGNALAIMGETTSSSPAMLFKIAGTEKAKINADGLLAPLPIASTTGSMTLDPAAHRIIWLNDSGGTITATIPAAASTNKGIPFTFVKTSSSNSCLFQTGISTTLNTSGESITLMNDATTWRVIDRFVPSEWQTGYTVTSTWGTTNVAYTTYLRRDGDEAELSIRLDFSGAPSATGLEINLPTGIAVDTAKMQNDVDDVTLGECNFNDSGSDYYFGRVKYVSASVLKPVVFTVSGTRVSTWATISNTVPFTIASGDQLFIRIKIPVSGWKG